MKYPSTPHLSWSPGVQRDDSFIKTLAGFVGREIVVTEKMDGENTTMRSDIIHARSLDSKNHPSRNYVKQLWGGIKHLIPEGRRLCGENLYAKHSISYDNLESYFYGFSIWDGDEALSWDETVKEFTEVYRFPTVPVIWRGIFDIEYLKDISKTFNTDKSEGYVVRVTDRIDNCYFALNVAKWVRPGHVQTDKHWMHSTIVPNKLK